MESRVWISRRVSGMSIYRTIEHYVRLAFVLVVTVLVGLVVSWRRMLNHASRNTGQLVSQINAFNASPHDSSSAPSPAFLVASCPPLSEVLQIRPRSHSKDELPAGVRHNRELLLSAPIDPSTEEFLELFQCCLGGDDLVSPAATLEPVHGLLDRVAVLDLAFFEQLLEMRDADVAEQGAVCL
jgi:hypothetical protein